MLSETTRDRSSRQSPTRSLLYLLVTLLVAVSVYLWLRPKPAPAQIVKAQFMQDIDELDSTVSQLQRAIALRQSSADLQAAFRRARLAYKRVEFISAYYSPETTRALNGPNIPDVDDDLRVNAPEGFQVLEEQLFPSFDPAHQGEAAQTAAVIRSNVNRLRKISEGNELTDSHVFDAMRLEVFRVITLGITGFDSPIAFHSLPEATRALESLQYPLTVYALADRNPALAGQLDRAFAGAIGALQSETNFDRFDRLSFITQHANVLSGLLLDAQKTLTIPVFTESRLLSPAARTLTDSGVFNANHFVNRDEQRSTPGRVALGKMLFFDPILSGNGTGGPATRTCATCHQPDKAFTDGEHKSLAVGVGGQRISRNAPTLMNASLQAVQFMDSRVVFLEDQASDVITNQNEMHGSLPEAVRALAQHSQYRELFAKSYKEGVTEHTLKNAVASYIRSLTSLDSRVDRALRGKPALLTAEEKLGFNVFMGKGQVRHLPLFSAVQRNGAARLSGNRKRSDRDTRYGGWQIG